MNRYLSKENDEWWVSHFALLGYWFLTLEKRALDRQVNPLGAFQMYSSKTHL